MGRHARSLTDPSQAVVYSRVSTEEQAEKGASLQAQRAETNEYARRNGLTIAHEYIERGVTGTDDRRPEFRRMLDALGSPGNRIGTVLVSHTSRFMRDATKARIHKAQLRRQGVRVVSVQQPIEDDAMGRFVEGVFELVDELESEQIGRRTRAGMTQNAVNGFWNGSQPPYGFRVQKVAGPGGSVKCRLEVNPAEAETLKRIASLYIANHGAVAVAKRLNADGVRHRGKLWDRDTVLRVVSDTAAIGQARWGRRDSRTGLPRPEKDVVVLPVDPILDRELFELVQDERARRDPEKNPGRAASSPLLLAGLVRCGQCGARYELQTSGKARPDGTRYAYYQCSRARRSGVGSACIGRPIAVDALDKAVMEFMLTAVFSEDRCRAIIRDLVEREGVLRHKAAQNRRRWESEARDLAKRRARLLESIETGSVAPEMVSARLVEVGDALARVVAMLEKVSVIHETPPQLWSRESLARFQVLLRAALFSDQGTARAYLRALVEQIVIYADGRICAEGRTSSVAAHATGAGFKPR